VRINIADTGVGLSPEQLHQLFQAFNRLGQEKKLERSIGIGLFVCKQLVNLMDGTIGADSQPGVGSDFWIEFVASYPPGSPQTSPEPHI
jgi:signal transduction histidine kinase